MYSQFRTQYPMGSLTSELVHMQQGHYVVRAIVQVGEVTLATGLSAAETVEQAEDQARSRALVVLGIESGYAHLLDSPPPPPARLNPAPQNQELKLSMPEQHPAWEESVEMASEFVEPEPKVPPRARNGRRRSTNKAAASPAGPIDLSEIIAQTDVELKRLGWTNMQGRQYLEQTYNKRSRQQLTDEELLEFLQTLQDLPIAEPPF
jgi:hypothetical protein